MNIEDMEETAEVENVSYYTLDGIQIEKPVNGIYFKTVRYKNGRIVTKKYSSTI